MFQDIEPSVFNNDFAWVEPERHDRVLVYRANNVLTALSSDLAGDEQADGHECLSLHFPSYGALCDCGAVGALDDEARTKRIDGAIPEAVYLFTVGETSYFRCDIDDVALDRALEAQGDCDEAFRYSFLPVSRLHAYGPRHRVFAGMVGYEYHVWYDGRRFCGRCGARMAYGLPERMMQCPSCGALDFSKLFPAVIVGIVDRERDRVLVSRYANREYKRYALIAGFCEMGETVEQTVHREVKEEVGLEVTGLRYYKSQPWPDSNSLLFGFFCDLDGAAAIKLDDHELEHAEWLPREELPTDEADYSLTRDMMRVLRERRELES